MSSGPKSPLWVLEWNQIQSSDVGFPQSGGILFSEHAFQEVIDKDEREKRAGYLRRAANTLAPFGDRLWLAKNVNVLFLEQMKRQLPLRAVDMVENRVTSFLRRMIVDPAVDWNRAVLMGEQSAVLESNHRMRNNFLGL